MLTFAILPSLEVPPLPGATKTVSTFSDKEIRQARACSRPPLPITSILARDVIAKVHNCAKSVHEMRGSRENWKSNHVGPVPNAQRLTVEETVTLFSHFLLYFVWHANWHALSLESLDHREGYICAHAAFAFPREKPEARCITDTDVTNEHTHRGKMIRLCHT